MKKFLILATVGLAAVGGSMAAAAPAQAGGFSLTISNGHGGGIVFANGKASHYQANRGWQRTDYYHQARQTYGGGHGKHAGPALGKGFTYIPGTVNAIKRSTGGKVTSIVFRNGVYHVEGFGRRGRFNTAKADPYTGKLYDVSPSYAPRYVSPHAAPIPRILAKLRQQGYSRFDRVDLKGKSYRVRGLDSYGNAVVVTADARTGHVHGVRKAKRYNLAAAAPAYQTRPWTHWQRHVKNQHYSHFQGAKFVKADNAWTDHYRVRGRNRHGKNVDLRVCAYTGKLLGWRYI